MERPARRRHRAHQDLLYTGVRVTELVGIRLDDVDLGACRIRITHGKGGRDRYVPFHRVQRNPRPAHRHRPRQGCRVPVRVLLEKP
ncbi:MAG TPA: tyrosine-type recombinase/integrase [Pseudonocardiaceae bacterium]